VLIVGLGWIAIGFVILRFTQAAVAVLAMLFGAVYLLAAAAEVTVGALSSPGWRAARWSLAVMFVVAAVIAFLAVRATVVGLAAVMGFLFIVRGAVGVVAAVAAHTQGGWWVVLFAGLAELAIGVMIAGSLTVSTTTLLIWVAAGTLVHGIGQFTAAFLVRKVGRHLAARRT